MSTFVLSLDGKTVHLSSQFTTASAKHARWVLTLLALGRVATGEELLPVNHLLPGQVSEVPSHVREPLQDALQTVPLSEYSPLDHYSGAFDKLAVCLYCKVLIAQFQLQTFACNWYC